MAKRRDCRERRQPALLGLQGCDCGCGCAALRHSVVSCSNGVLHSSSALRFSTTSTSVSSCPYFYSLFFPLGRFSSACLAVARARGRSFRLLRVSVPLFEAAGMLDVECGE